MSLVSATFAEDLALLRAHGDVVVLSDGDAAAVIAPAIQGRVMTSTASGPDGASFGWIHRSLIASRRRERHINAFGGEDRLWLGPEGGQFALYFDPSSPFDLDHWQVPEPIDWGPWPLVDASPMEVRLTREMDLQSYAATRFRLRVDRTVRLLTRDAIAAHLSVPLPTDARCVGFESINTLTNTGSAPWRKETGLVSLWVLGMFAPSPDTTVVVPYRAGPESALGPIVNSAYFAEVPPSRLATSDRAIFFRGDGAHRSKIGVARPRALPVLGSYAESGGLLTLVAYTLPDGATDYVSSMWELQARPYEGDVVNSYNDGPPAPGVPPLGPFYELETSSPAAALGPGEQLTHVHRTMHVTGDEATLDAVATAVLGVGLDDIRRALPA